MNNKKNFIPVSRPVLHSSGRKYLIDAYDSGWISSKGSYIEKFEKKFALWNGVKYGSAVSSGLSALILGLRGIGIRQGDEVIVPEFTMIASAWAVSIIGAKPVFVDCGNDLNIDISKIEEKITKNTKAIMPVHLYGRSCDMKSIMVIAKKYKLKVIEDSAESHGVKPKGDVACFSLFGNKIITSGEGGICLTNNKKVDRRIKWLRSMAFNPEHTFLHKELGYNFRMTNMRAAVALSQVEVLNNILNSRKIIEDKYDKFFEKLYDKHFLRIKKRNVLWMYDIYLKDHKKRDKLKKFLFDNGIDTRVVFKPMSQQPMYKNNESYKKLKAFDFSIRGLYLPTPTDLSDYEIKYITSKVLEFFNK